MTGRSSRRPIYVYTPTPTLRARVRLELRRDHVPHVSFHDPAQVDAFTRADQTRRLELWVDCWPEEFSRHPRPDELLGLVVEAGDRRAVLCTRYNGPTWMDDLAKVAMFDRLPIGEWNEPVCPRCRCDATVRTDEGLWWCKRHSTRAWEPIEHREGVAWQEQRLPG